MDKCFVIQPFDKDKFDKRFVDIFEPAILKADLEAYRIDKDLSVRIPIEDIEKGIMDSAICFAEITTDNPNVWYELGYAFACDKDVVMVCSDERTGNFPFDIQHKTVIKYKTSSISDFKLLEETITNKLRAFKQKSKKIDTLSATPVVETEGLKSHEIAVLILLTENVLTAQDSFSVNNLQNEMKKAGYTDIATSIGIRTLVKKGMISTLTEINRDYDVEYTVCKLTDMGETWILSNQDRFQFRKTAEEKEAEEKANLNKDNIIIDDLPF
jgi:hypothetical protein